MRAAMGADSPLASATVSESIDSGSQHVRRLAMAIHSASSRHPGNCRANGSPSVGRTVLFDFFDQKALLENFQMCQARCAGWKAQTNQSGCLTRFNLSLLAYAGSAGGALLANRQLVSQRQRHRAFDMRTNDDGGAVALSIDADHQVRNIDHGIHR